jgi:hypothetical protein
VRVAKGGEGSEGSEGSVGVNSRASAIPEAKPSGVAEICAGIRDAEGVTGVSLGGARGAKGARVTHSTFLCVRKNDAIARAACRKRGRPALCGRSCVRIMST